MSTSDDYDLAEFLRRPRQARAHHPGRRAGRVRPRRGVRGRARARSTTLVTAHREGRRRGGLHVPARSSTARSSRRPTTSTRSRTSRARSSASSARSKQARELAERVHAGKPWGDLHGHDRRLPQPGRLLPGLSELHRHAARKGPPRHDVQLGLPPRAVARADAHAVVPRARVRARRHAGRGRGVARHVARSAALELLEALGLPAKSDVASDPFFGRGGKMLADGQKEQKLKFEVLVPVISKEKPDRGVLVQLPPGPLRQGLRDQAPPTARSPTPRASASASSACVMALFQTHGFDPDEWPKAVREQLWP